VAGGKLVGHAVGAVARHVVAAETEAKAKDPMWWWFTRALVAVTLIAGWIFILVQNKFHIDAPVVVIMLAYFAVVMTVANLWRVGASAVASDAVNDGWDRPLGERAELEREKKTLLKAIKEAEFDLAMKKLSKADADGLIAMYRARAIEVIKELERLDAGAAETPRARIEREVAARLEIEQRTKSSKKAKRAKAADAKKADEAKKVEETRNADDADDAEEAQQEEAS
jgi:hypothetical protein